MALHSFALRRDTGPPADIVESFLNTFEVYLNANNVNNTAQLAFNSGTLGVDANGQLGATVGVEASDPLLLSLTGSPHIYLPGTAGTANNVMIPDSAAIDAVGNVTLRVAFAPATATPATASEIMTKGSSWVASGLNYGIGIGTGGHAVMKVTDSSATTRTWTSSVPAWTLNGSLVMVEADLNVGTAAVTFRTKVLTDVSNVAGDCASDIGWVALGTPIAGTITGSALLPNTDTLKLITTTLAGKFYYGEVRQTGSVVTTIDPRSAASAGALTWTTANGQTATVNRAVSGAKTTLVTDSAVWVFDGGDYIDVPDHPTLDLAAGEELTVIAVVREHATQSTGARIVGKANATANNDGYLINKSAADTVSGAIRDGTTTNTPTVVTGFTASAAHVVGLTVSATQVRTWVDGLPAMTGSPLVPVPATARTATDCTNALPLRIGADSTGANFFSGEVIAVAVTKRVLAIEEMVGIASYFLRTGFTGGYGDWLRPLEDGTPLRSDNYSNVPASSGTAYFDVAPIGYNDVRIDWNVVVADLTNIQVVSSLEGHPVTVLDGRLVVSVSSLQAQGSVVDDQAVPGRWHYYSIFAKIDDGSTPHFERVSTANCLVAFNHRSTELLYRRVPPWYQEQDTDGDLFKFLNLFGYEMDFARSMCDVLRDIRDPDIIPAAALYEAGRMIGIPRVVEGISETRYRALLRNFAYLNSIKGTEAGIEQYLSVITGTKVAVDVLGTNNIGISLYAQRVNLIREPIMNGALWIEAPFVGSPTASYSNGECTVTTAAAIGTEWIFMTDIPFDPASVYSFSLLVASATAGSRLRIVMVSQTNLSSVLLVDWMDILGSNLLMTTPPMVVPPWTTPDWLASTKVTLRIEVILPANGTLRFKEPILEPGTVGDYFDGNSISGGFLPGSTGVQDFRWLGSANASVSAYTMNYGVVAGVAETVLPYIVPAGMKVGSAPGEQYAITNYNKYPGS